MFFFTNMDNVEVYLGCGLLEFEVLSQQYEEPLDIQQFLSRGNLNSLTCYLSYLIISIRCHFYSP